MAMVSNTREDEDVAPVRLALRVGEAAAALSISRSKMYGLIKEGKVRSSRR